MICVVISSGMLLAFSASLKIIGRPNRGKDCNFSEEGCLPEFDSISLNHAATLLANAFCILSFLDEANSVRIKYSHNR